MPEDVLDPEYAPEFGDVARTSGADEEADGPLSLAGLDGV